VHNGGSFGAGPPQGNRSGTIPVQGRGRTTGSGPASAECELASWDPVCTDRVTPLQVAWGAGATRNLSHRHQRFLLAIPPGGGTGAEHALGRPAAGRAAIACSWAHRASADSRSSPAASNWATAFWK